jgi:predicted phage tail protein
MSACAMRDVVLCGELGRIYGRRHFLAVKSPAEAIRAMMANYRTFERDVIALSKRSPSGVFNANRCASPSRMPA